MNRPKEYKPREIQSRRPSIITRARRVIMSASALTAAVTISLVQLTSADHAQTVVTNNKENTMTQVQKAPDNAADEAIRPFHVNIPQEQLDDLRRRIKATKWPESETVPDDTQGVQLATMKKLADYWAKDYDCRKIEAKLNSYPQFVTNIDGPDIHFINVKSKVKNALPVIIT